MKEISPSFCGAPGESPHHYYRNVVLEFKKVLLHSKDLDQLLIVMEKLLNASKDMTWKSNKPGVWKKEEGEKAIGKLFQEFKRYLGAFNSDSSKANPQFLIDVLDEIKSELDRYDVE